LSIIEVVVARDRARQAGEEIMPFGHELRHHLAAASEAVVLAGEEEQRVGLIFVQLRGQRFAVR